MESRDVRPGVPVYSYSGPGRGREYEAWREEFCRGFCQLDAEPTATERIECMVEVARIGSLSFGAARGTSGSFVRTRGLLSDGRDDFVLVTATAGDVFTVQRGQTVELRSPEMCLLALDSVGESGLANCSGYTALRIPRRELLEICREAEDRMCKPLTASPNLREAVRGYFALCTATAPSLDALTQHAMARHMTELVGFLLKAESDQTPPPLQNGYGAARLQLVQAQILRRLGEADLTIGCVARHAGLTPKQIQRLFGTSGTTFAEFVLEQRLLLARRKLASGDGQREKIGSIAQDSGFGDLSYFNRSFRRRFGMTPSEWRGAGIADAA